MDNARFNKSLRVVLSRNNMNETAELIKQIQDIFNVPRENVIVTTSNPDCIEALKKAGVQGMQRKPRGEDAKRN